MAALGSAGVDTEPSKAVVADTPPTTDAPTTTTTEAPTTTAAPTATTQPPLPAPAPSVTVTDVIDGDTVEVNTGERVRLVGIDTPEAGTGECASRATARLTDLVLYQPVVLVAGARDDSDRYGRLLRYVDANSDVGYQLIVEGLAIARYDSRDGYGRHTREAEYVAADSASRNCASASAPAPRPAPPAPAPAPAPGVSYANCDAARAAGAAPLYTGQPGYAPKLDRDGDGVACE
jgi:endonuclease YncB( thermonuclease family)